MLGDQTVDATVAGATPVGNADPAAQPDASAPSQPDPAEPSDEQKSRSAESKRINRLLSDRYRERERANAAEAKLREYESRQQQVSQQTPAQSDEGPQQETWKGDYQSFLDARSEWKAGQAAKRVLEESQTASRAAEQQRQAQESLRERVVAFEAARADIESQVPDYAESLKSMAHIESPALANALLDSEKGADVMYYLANHVDEAERLAAMSPGRAAVEVGRLEHKATQFVQSRVKSKVPAQGQPLASSGATPRSGEPSEADGSDDWIRKRLAQRARNRR